MSAEGKSKHVFSGFLGMGPHPGGPGEPKNLDSNVEEQPHIDEDDKIFSKRNFKNYIANALYTLGSTFSNGLSTYQMFVFTEFFGLGAALVSVIMSIGTIVDALTDLLAGVVMDRFHTKSGKAVHWIRWLAFPSAICMIAIFMCPVGATTTFKCAYIVVVSIVSSTILTFCRMPATAMMSLGSDNQSARTVFAWVSNFCGMFGGTILGLMLIWVSSWFGGMDTMGLFGYRAANAVFAGIGAVFVCSAAFLFQEKHSGAEIDAEEDRRFREKGRKKESFIEQIRRLGRNKYWVMIQCMNLISIIGNFSSGVAVYFCTYVMGSTTLSAVMMAIGTIPGMVGAAVIIPFVKKFDCRTLVLFGTVGSTITSVAMWFVATRSVTALIVTFVIKNFFFGTTMSIQGSLMGRVIDYGEWKFGERLDGMSFAGQSLVNKVGQSLGNIVLGVILTAVGYVGGSTMLPDTAIFGIKFLYLATPIISGVGTIIVMILFDLTQKKVDKMRIEIDERHAAQQMNDLLVR